AAPEGRGPAARDPGHHGAAFRGDGGARREQGRTPGGAAPAAERLGHARDLAATEQPRHAELVGAAGTRFHFGARAAGAGQRQGGSEEGQGDRVGEDQSVEKTATDEHGRNTEKDRGDPRNQTEK